MDSHIQEFRKKRDYCIWKWQINVYILLCSILVNRVILTEDHCVTSALFSAQESNNYGKALEEMMQRIRHGKTLKSSKDRRVSQNIITLYIIAETFKSIKLQATSKCARNSISWWFPAKIGPVTMDGYIMNEWWWVHYVIGYWGLVHWYYECL